MINANYFLLFNIISDAPGTASPIPGLLTPFAFNPAMDVAMALVFAMAGGILGGFIVSTFFLNIRNGRGLAFGILKNMR